MEIYFGFKMLFKKNKIYPAFPKLTHTHTHTHTVKIPLNVFECSKELQQNVFWINFIGILIFNPGTVVFSCFCLTFVALFEKNDTV